MTAAPRRLDLTPVKERQRKMWASGDYTVVASRLVSVSEMLADAADLRAGWRVLDVACGNGNTALAAARRGTQVVGVDYVPELLEDGRQRAIAEGLDVEFRLGDAEDLPADDGSFDAVVSVFGMMFAPDHRGAVAEIVRVARPGATVALASWTPEGFVGQVLATVARHVPPEVGTASPLLWGTEDHVSDLFAAAAGRVESRVRSFTFRHSSPEDFVAFFRRWYGPILTAFETLEPTGQRALARDLADLARHVDRYGDDRSAALPSTYLETLITLQ